MICKSETHLSAKMCRSVYESSRLCSEDLDNQELHMANPLGLSWVDVTLEKTCGIVAYFGWNYEACLLFIDEASIICICKQRLKNPCLWDEHDMSDVWQIELLDPYRMSSFTCSLSLLLYSSPGHSFRQIYLLKQPQARLELGFS